MAKAAKTGEVEVMAMRNGEVTFCILGQTALYFNCMAGKAMRELLMPRGQLTKAQKTTNLKHDPYAEFRNSCERRGEYENGATRLLMPSTAFKKSLMSAALDMPTGVAKTQIGRLAWVVGEKIDIYGIPKLSMEVVRSADMNKTPDIRTRAVCDEWAARVTFRFVEPNLTAQAMATLLAAAGMLIGVGDKRQEKGAGNQGQFILVAETDPDFERIVRTGGMAAQDAALEAAEPRDAQSDELLRWFDDEITRRGREGQTSTKKQQAAA